MKIGAVKAFYILIIYDILSEQMGGGSLFACY